FSEHLAKSIEYFEKACRLSRKDEETLVNLAFLHSFRQMHQTGLKYGTRAVMCNPRSSKAHLVCGMLYTENKDFQKAEKEFSTAFLLMSEEDRKPYEDISPLLSPDERDLYLSSSSMKKQDWNRRFWAECDPTPATETNERRLEHLARVVIADLALSDERRDVKGTDTDRSAALIRFGLPDKKLYDLGGGTSGGWIVWQYEGPGGSFNLYFNDEFLNGDYHFPISDSYGEVSRNLLNTVPQRYEYPIEFAPFSISIQIAERRGTEDRTRLEFSVAIPDSIRQSKSQSWDLYVTFFDSEWNRFSRDRITLKPDSLQTIEKSSGRYLVSNFCLEMLPRALGCTCIVELVLDKDLRKATRRYPLDIREMHGTSLRLSDIKLMLPDSSGACSTVLDPLPLYREKGKFCLSYEAYNLRLDENGESRYRLTYSIRSPEHKDDQTPASLRKTLSYMWSSVTVDKPTGKPYIESSIEQRAHASVVSDALQIDIEALQSGTYMLYISVEDLANGAVASESRLFTISE
ncbi:MAG: GWxTD domain-containing protein, partial [Candidatus Krumholzibacteria bacterium]|nr:GWxTD domain-containing protein [Candidatus Krumholzibacteria bacterium]